MSFARFAPAESRTILRLALPIMATQLAMVGMGTLDTVMSGYVSTLDLAGVAVSTGSACASGAIEPSHVILALGHGEDAARRAVRVSLGWSTRQDDVDRFVELLPEVVERVREGMQSPVEGSSA